MYLNYKRMASFSCFTAFLLVAANAFAHVGSGGNCANCHDPDTNRMNVTGNTGTLSLTPSRLDFGNTQPLKLFTVTQGQSVPLTINVTNGGASGDSYGVALTGTLKSAVLESLTSTTIKGVKTSTADALGLITDPSWTSATPVKTGSNPTPADSFGKTYFEQGKFTWAGTPVSKTYNLGVSAATPPDVYTLTLRAAGVDSGMWTQSEEILLQVLPIQTPEPSTILLMLSAVAFGLVAAWRKRR
jgi:hypothetical protein